MKKVLLLVLQRCRWCPAWIMPLGAIHLYVGILDDREEDLDAEVALDAVHSCDVGEVAVDREAEQVTVERLELVVRLGEGHELGGADGSEVGWPLEQHQPAALLVLQLLHTGRVVVAR